MRILRNIFSRVCELWDNFAARSIIFSSLIILTSAILNYLGYKLTLGLYFAAILFGVLIILKPKHWYLVILVVLPAVTFLGLHEGPFGLGNLVKVAIVCLLFWFYLIKILSSARYKLVRTPLNFPLVCFFVFGIIYIFIHSVSLSCGAASFFEHALYFLVFFVVASIIFDKQQIRLIYLAIIGGAVIVSLIGIAFILLNYEQGLGIYLRASSFFGYVNLLGVYLAIVNALCLSRLIYVRSKTERIFLLFALLLGIVALLLTFSIRSWLALGIASIVIALMANKKQLILGATACALLLIVLVVPNIRDEGRNWGLLDRIQKSMGARYGEYDDAWLKFSEYPLLGTGLGSSGTVALVLEPSDSLYVHNYYFQILIEMGIIGLILYIWIFLAAFTMTIRAFMRTEDIYLKGFALGTLATLTIISITAFVGTANSSFPVNFYTWFLLGVTAAIYAKSKTMSDGTERC